MNVMVIVIIIKINLQISLLKKHTSTGRQTEK